MLEDEVAVWLEDAVSLGDGEHEAVLVREVEPVPVTDEVGVVLAKSWLSHGSFATKPDGMFNCPNELSPQHVMMPLLLNAHACVGPISTATWPDRHEAGGEVSDLALPKHEIVPFIRPTEQTCEPPHPETCTWLSNGAFSQSYSLALESQAFQQLIRPSASRVQNSDCAIAERKTCPLRTRAGVYVPEHHGEPQQVAPPALDKEHTARVAPEIEIWLERAAAGTYPPQRHSFWCPQPETDPSVLSAYEVSPPADTATCPVGLWAQFPSKLPPQQVACPEDIKPHVCAVFSPYSFEAETSIKVPPGGEAWPQVFSPQQCNVLSERMAHVYPPPTVKVRRPAAGAEEQASRSANGLAKTRETAKQTAATRSSAARESMREAVRGL